MDIHPSFHKRTLIGSLNRATHCLSVQSLCAKEELPSVADPGPRLRTYLQQNLYNTQKTVLAKRGQILVFTRKLANCLAAFNCFQRIAELVGRRVSPSFLDHDSAAPRAWTSAPIYTLARGPVLGPHPKDKTMRRPKFKYGD